MGGDPGNQCLDPLERPKFINEHSEQARAPHKRTKGRASVWGSEFTSKDATKQGGFSRNRSYAERKIVDFSA